MDIRMRRPGSDRDDGKLAARIFAVLAATFLVGAVALGTVLPPDMTLFEAVHVLDSARADAAQAAAIGQLGQAVWNAVAVPMLLRPVWLLPLSIGIVFAGGGLSFSFPPSPKPRRWHS